MPCTCHLAPWSHMQQSDRSILGNSYGAWWLFGCHPAACLFPPPAAQVSPWIQMNLLAGALGNVADSHHWCPLQGPLLSLGWQCASTQGQMVPYMLLSLAPSNQVSTMGNEESASSWSHQKNSLLQVRSYLPSH